MALSAEKGHLSNLMINLSKIAIKMFQTDIHHFLQSFASDGLTYFMQFMTALGYIEFFMLLLIFIIFAIDFKKGFILLMVLIWTGAFTFFLKDYFALPRPFHVDNTIQLLDGQLPDATSFSFSHQGASSFWGTLPESVVAETRKHKDIEHGFPSGHTSIAVTLWAMIALLFRRRWLGILCVALMILIPFSRLYLGVHFLADVLGGYVLGFGLLFLFYKTILKPDRLATYLTLPQLNKDWNRLSVFVLTSPLLLFLLVSVKAWVLVSYAFGFGIGFYILGQRGFPLNAGTRGQRLMRFAAAGGLLLVIKVLMKSLFMTMDLGMEVWTDFFRHVVEGVLLVWVAVELFIRWGWWKRKAIV